MSAELARRRLWQAKCFYHDAESCMAHRERYSTYLEAFIAFGRSVWDVLERETKEKGKRHTVGRCVEERWKPLLKDGLLAFFRRTGNMMLHEGRDPAHAQYAMTIRLGVMVSDSASVRVERADGTVEESSALPAAPVSAPLYPAEMPPEHSVHYIFAEGALQGQDVMDKGREYLERLEAAIQIADECGT